MQKTAAKIHQNNSLHEVEDEIVAVKEIFRLQNVAELKAADDKYLPKQSFPNTLEN